MSIKSAGISEQDRTLSDLLESYRHHQSDPSIPDERKREASERMKSVWSKLAKIQDPDGFISHLTEHIQREYQRRNHHESNPNITRRAKPLCRCGLSRHLCDAKQGTVPSKIQTQNLKHIQKPDSQTLARQYVQTHAGDVVVREAIEDFRDLRSSVYAELSDILAMMMGQEPLDTDSEPEESHSAAATPPEGETQQMTPAEATDATATQTASADGGVDGQPTANAVDSALASVVERHGAEALAKEAADGALDLMGVINAHQNGEVSTEDLQAVADGEKSLSELEVVTDDSGDDRADGPRSGELFDVDTTALNGGDHGV